jgi:hypothetical protein
MAEAMQTIRQTIFGSPIGEIGGGLSTTICLNPFDSNDEKT